MMMKKSLIALVIAAMGMSVANAATEATAVATWQATAKKDVTADLVVTPLGSLAFQYAEGIKGFNTVNGLFDVTVKGQAGTTDDPITDFTLKAKKLSGTLNHLAGGSTVDVGVFWMGQPLTTSAYTFLIDTSKGITGGNLSPLAEGFNKNGQRTSAQSQFSFNIEKATVAGAPAPFNTLPDGLWSGQVNVEFVANWS